MLNYLSAAKSAQERGDIQKRDEYIDLAHNANDTEDLAVKFTQANLYVESGQLESALAILLDIQSQDKKNAYALNLINDIYIKIHNWDDIIKSIPRLRKLKTISAEKIKEVEKLAFHNILTKHLKDENNLDFKSTYSSMPKYLQSEESFIVMQAKCYIQTNDIQFAEKLLIKYLKYAWSDNLIELFGTIVSNDGAKQLKVAEEFLRQNSESAALHAALARISVRNQLWGKARSYFEESLHISPSVSIFAELGDLLNLIGEYDLAAQCYKNGLALSAAS